MSDTKTLNVAMIGAGFMGKAHSNAYLKVNKFFELPANIVMHTLVARPEVGRAVAGRWGWRNVVDDPRQAFDNPDIGLIDICTPNNAHADLAVAAAKAGKPVACEKPLADNLADATVMANAIRKARTPSFVWFNYRRVPAIALARKMIDEGRLGQVYHFRAAYLQDWIMDPNFPLVWRLRKEVAGSGSLGDLAAHSVDTARWLVGEFDSVSGHLETFIKTRPLEAARATRGLDGVSDLTRKGKVTVDDAAIFLARFTNGALGTFEATRFARGRKNRNQFEISGAKGALAFNFEQMNQLEYFDATLPKHVQGWSTIMATEPVHPYAAAWWPPGHVLGYEHGAINQAADIVRHLAGPAAGRFRPDFEDGLACQRVLEAVERSSKTAKWIKVSSVK